MLEREQKVAEYIEALKKSKYLELKENKFSDYSSMQKWYNKESTIIRNEVKANQEINNERMLEIIDIANIDNIKRAKNGIISMQQQIEEYKEKVLELKRNVKKSDNLKFSSGRPMKNWLYYNLQKIDNLNNINQLPEKRQKEIEDLLELKSLVEKYTEKKKILTFEDKVEEYRFKMFEVGRGISINDDYKFSNGDPMKYFLSNEIMKIKSTAKKYKIIRKQDLSKIKDIAHILKCRENLESKSKVKHR